MAEKRYFFELECHVNYFHDTTDAEFENVLIEVSPEVGEAMWEDEDEVMLEIVQDIEGQTVTHNFAGMDNGKYVHVGYGLYEAERHEIDHIVDLWRTALEETFGAENFGETIRYSFTVPEDQEDSEIYDQKREEAINSHQPLDVK